MTDSRSGSSTFDSKLISLLPLDEVPVHVHPFAARAPCDSKGSECQCGIHRAEAASALWIPHWHSEPFESQRGAGGEGVDVNGNLVEREKGDVWNRNSCVLIDYRLWAAKSEGRPWVDQCLDHHLNLHLNLGVGCAPSCWPIFGFRTSWVLAGGTEGSFLCSLSSRFSGRGGGVG